MKNISFRKATVSIITLLLTVSTLGGCNGIPKFSGESSFPKESDNESKSDPIDVDTSSMKEYQSYVDKIEVKAQQILKDMTLREKIGQLFIIRPESLQRDITSQQVHDNVKFGAIEWNLNMEDMIKKYPPGGIALFGKNIVSPSQLTSFVDDMQDASTIPLFMGIDEEGGIVSRIANSKEFNVTKYKTMEDIGATQNGDKAREVGVTIGTYLKDYGFNLDFAPVADTNTNPENRVIGKRSFGSDPNLVSTMVNAEIEGFHQVGMITCIKHFPGHGDTKGDTHEGYVSIDKNWDQLKSCELIPFINALHTTDMVMISHITTPNITKDGLPASLSKEMIEGRLRNDLGYEGVVITDSLAMGAIAQQYSSADSAIKSISAGVDILLMPEDYIEAYEGVYEAVENKIISEQRIDESVLRILKLKLGYIIW